MICKRNKKNNSVVLAIEGDIFIQDVTALRESILAGLADSPKVVMDLSNVGEIDTAGAQLLLAATRSASDCGKCVLLQGGRQAVSSIEERLGLELAGGK